MTATARIATTDWDLTAVRVSAGETCSHCGRTLRHVYDLRNTATGEVMTVGRTCCKDVTGWSLTLAEARAELRYRETLVKRAAKWAAFTAEHPELAAVIDADHAAGRPNAYAVKTAISDRRACYADRQYAQAYVSEIRARS